MLAVKYTLLLSDYATMLIPWNGRLPIPQSVAEFPCNCTRKSEFHVVHTEEEKEKKCF